MSIETRKKLKALFKEGTLPEENDFATLIDSLAHVDEFNMLRVWLLKLEKALGIESQEPGDYDEPEQPDKPQNGEREWPGIYFKDDKVGIGIRQPVSKLEAAGWMAMVGRLGTYEPRARDAGKRGRHPSVDADGQWKILIPKPVGSYVFEVVAHANAPGAHRPRALTHAIAVTSFNTSSKSIRQVRSRTGFFGGNAIYLKWRKRKRRWYDWFKSDIPYDLCIRTGKDFGRNAAQKNPVQIHYHITLLWADTAAEDVEALEKRGTKALPPAEIDPRLLNPPVVTKPVTSPSKTEKTVETESKKKIQSKTFWGVILFVLASAFGDLQDNMGLFTEGQLPTDLIKIFTAAAAAWAAWGIRTAKLPIKGNE